MKTRALYIICLVAFAACSKQTTTKSVIKPPIYVSFDTDGKWLFGPVSQECSLCDGRAVIAGTDHVIRVFCSALHERSCTLTFREDTKEGQTIRQEDRTVPLGISNNFKIFDTVDVTLRNHL